MLTAPAPARAAPAQRFASHTEIQSSTGHQRCKDQSVPTVTADANHPQRLTSSQVVYNHITQRQVYIEVCGTNPMAAENVLVATACCPTLNDSNEGVVAECCACNGYINGNTNACCAVSNRVGGAGLLPWGYSQL